MLKLSQILRSLPFRVCFAVICPLILFIGAWFLYTYEQGPPCIFHSLTGIYCPGCGSGRASVALLHGDILTALRNNLLFTLFIPLISYYCFKIYIKVVFLKDIIPFFKVSFRLCLIILVLIILFTVLRNIPGFPFDLIAPIPVGYDL